VRALLSTPGERLQVRGDQQEQMGVHARTPLHTYMHAPLCTLSHLDACTPLHTSTLIRTHPSAHFHTWTHAPLCTLAHLDACTGADGKRCLPQDVRMCQ